MGKAEPGSLKAFANKQKSKGLQKLRWYCEMCQKQCRDENGFKCHTKSESHLRQIQHFAKNASQFCSSFSAHFENAFLKILKRKGGRVFANSIYQEYISDKNHVHMSATRWKSLTTFVQSIAIDGKVKLDSDEKGFYVEYIHRDPELLARQEAESKREMEKLSEEELQQKIIEMQMAKALESAEPDELPQYTELKRDPDQKMSFSLKPKAVHAPLAKSVLIQDEDSKEEINILSKRRHSEVDDVGTIPEDTASKKPCNNIGKRKENWITKGLIVKIMNKKLLEGEFYKEKGEIIGVYDLFLAEVETEKGVIKLDQAELETVLPNVNKLVRVVNGKYRGEDAVLLEINRDKFCANIELLTGSDKGLTVNDVEYEDICKIES